MKILPSVLGLLVDTYSSASSATANSLKELFLTSNLPTFWSSLSFPLSSLTVPMLITFSWNSSFLSGSLSTSL